MWPQFARAESVKWQLHGQLFLDGPGQGTYQRLALILFAISDAFAKCIGKRIEWLQTMAEFLRQRLEQGHRFFLEQAGHQPFATVV